MTSALLAAQRRGFAHETPDLDTRPRVGLRHPCRLVRLYRMLWTQLSEAQTLVLVPQGTRPLVTVALAQCAGTSVASMLLSCAGDLHFKGPRRLAGSAGLLVSPPAAISQEAKCRSALSCLRR